MIDFQEVALWIAENEVTCIDHQTGELDIDALWKMTLREFDIDWASNDSQYVVDLITPDEQDEDIEQG